MRPPLQSAAQRAVNESRHAPKTIFGSGLLEPAQVRLIRDHAAQLEEIAPLIPMVPTHGDAQVRNFLWDAPTQRLALIDFERAELAPAVRDLVRLEYGPWHGQPYLGAAFLAGYGRTLTATEETALQNFAALDALSALQWAPPTTTRTSSSARIGHSPGCQPKTSPDLNECAPET